MARKNRDLESDFAPPDRMSMAKETVASDSSVTTGDITLLAVIYRELKTAAILINFLITVSLIIIAYTRTCHNRLYIGGDNTCSTSCVEANCCHNQITVSLSSKYILSKSAFDIRQLRDMHMM